jgi:hypothetical protein
MTAAKDARDALDLSAFDPFRNRKERRRVETSESASFGFDDFLTAVGGDEARTPTNVGLRVPAFVPVDALVNPLGYLFLGARVDLDPGDRIVGYRTLASIGFAFNGLIETPLAAPLVPYERQIESAGWRFVDGMIDMHLTEEPKPPAVRLSGPFDQMSFAFEDANTPALLYETAHFPAVPTAPGYLGLDGYTPPPMRGKTDLLTLRDVRTRWQRSSALRIDVERPTTYRFYIRVVQSSPTAVEGGAPARFQPTVTPSDFTIEGLTKEDNFVQAFPKAIYWRVGVALLVERGRVPLRIPTPPVTIAPLPPVTRPDTDNEAGL